MVCISAFLFKGKTKELPFGFSIAYPDTIALYKAVHRYYDTPRLLGAKKRGNLHRLKIILYLLTKYKKYAI
jgi:hypothetical protein